jgi:hypothetical protein
LTRSRAQFPAIASQRAFDNTGKDSRLIANVLIEGQISTDMSASVREFCRASTPGYRDPAAFMGIDPQNIAQLKVNECFALKSTAERKSM